MTETETPKRSRLIAISNRTAAGQESRAGGLAVALWDSLADTRGLWIGWSGRILDFPSNRARKSSEDGVEFALTDYSRDQFDGFYLWLFKQRAVASDAQSYRSCRLRFFVLSLLCGDQREIFRHCATSGDRGRLDLGARLPLPAFGRYIAGRRMDRTLRFLPAYSIPLSRSLSRYSGASQACERPVRL